MDISQISTHYHEFFGYIFIYFQKKRIIKRSDKIEKIEKRTFSFQKHVFFIYYRFTNNLFEEINRIIRINS